VSYTFGPGDYHLDSPIVLREHGESVRGAGIEATRLFYSGTGPAICNAVPEGDSIHWGVGIGGFSLHGGGIALDSTYKARVDDVRIQDATGFGIRLYRSDPTKAFAAYNTLSNITVDLCGRPGNGIVLDAGSEVNYLEACNASYAQIGTVPGGYADELADTSTGIGLLIASGNNTVLGGHLDRCLFPLVFAFAESNDVTTATDNALGRAVVMKCAKGNTARIAIGRLDPLMPDGATNPRYGQANWAAVHACNVTAGNRTELRYRGDSNPPPLPTGRSSWPKGGWTYGLWENGSTGKPEHGGPNRWIVLPEGQMPYKLDGLGVIVR
jgi:hypothetical protein